MCQVPLVLDKSFLRSVPTKRLQDISKFHKILISDALTYEVAKDVDKTRAQLFSKLDAIKDEIEYIPIIGELIRFEQENCQASKRPSQGTLARNYSLISRLADCSNQLSSKQQNAVENYKFTSSDIHSSILDVIGSYFSEYSQRFAELKYKKLLDGEIRDTKFINSVIATERKNGALVPNVALFCGEWLTFRYFQVYQLFLFDIRRRYQSIDVILGNPKVEEKIYHDIYDMNYLILALHEGGFATSEKKLIRWWEAIHSTKGLVNS